MPFERPTLDELVERIESEIQVRLGVGPLLARSVLKVLGRVLAGATHGTHGHLDYVARQVIPLTADRENLERWADLFGLDPVRRPAEPAVGSATFTGTNGSTIPLGTLVQRADGTRYSTDAAATIAGGSALVALTAATAGSGGNAPAATTLSLVSPVSGVSATATVDGSGLTGGADIETDELLRARLRAFVGARPQGGSVADYDAWTREVAGVTRVFVLPAHLGLGTVGVTFVVDEDPLGPIPDAAKVAEVQARLTDQTRRDSAPVTAQVTAFAPAAVALDFTLSVTPNTTAVRDAVTAALEDLVLREAEPGGTITLHEMNEAISTAPGEEDHTLTSPAANFTVGAGELAVLGTITPT